MHSLEACVIGDSDYSKINYHWCYFLIIDTHFSYLQSEILIEWTCSLLFQPTQLCKFYLCHFPLHLNLLFCLGLTINARTEVVRYDSVLAQFSWYQSQPNWCFCFSLKSKLFSEKSFDVVNYFWLCCGITNQVNQLMPEAAEASLHKFNEYKLYRGFSSFINFPYILGMEFQDYTFPQ